jgi:hypothetical protein
MYWSTRCSTSCARSCARRPTEPAPSAKLPTQSRRYTVQKLAYGSSRCTHANPRRAMSDDLSQLCAREFARHVDTLFGKCRIETYSRGEEWVEVPVVGLFHHVRDEDAAAALNELARRASAARERFKTDGPPWAQPLPTSWDDCCKLARVGGRMELLGHYASSLLGSKWDETQPPFDVFCRGVMADRTTPAYLRNDPELRREFPPKPLEGLMSAEMAAALDLSEARVAAKAANR